MIFRTALRCFEHHAPFGKTSDWVPAFCGQSLTFTAKGVQDDVDSACSIS